MKTDCLPYAPGSEGASDIGESMIDNTTSKTLTEARPSAPLPPAAPSRQRAGFGLAAGALSLAILALLSVGVVAHSFRLKIEAATRTAEAAGRAAHRAETAGGFLPHERAVLGILINNYLSPPKGTETEIDPTTEGFSLLDCNAGRLLVSCDGVQPYLDGHKINLEIGNPFGNSGDAILISTGFGLIPVDRI